MSLLVGVGSLALSAAFAFDDEFEGRGLQPVERGVAHVTIYRWVQRFTPLLIDAARPHRHVPGDRWSVEET
jgi:hypothetical protein